MGSAEAPFQAAAAGAGPPPLQAPTWDAGRRRLRQRTWPGGRGPRQPAGAGGAGRPAAGAMEGSAGHRAVAVTGSSRGARIAGPFLPLHLTRVLASAPRRTSAAAQGASPAARRSASSSLSSASFTAPCWLAGSALDTWRGSSCRASWRSARRPPGSSPAISRSTYRDFCGWFSVGCLGGGFGWAVR